MIDSRSKFVRDVLQLYLTMPGTPERFSRYDRAIAQAWFDQNIPFHVIQQAMVVAVVRRTYRPQDMIPLGPIRSLHYFAPVIFEIQNEPLSVSYWAYLKRKFEKLMPSGDFC